MNMETIEIILLIELISFQAYLYTITLFANFQIFVPLLTFTLISVQLVKNILLDIHTIKILRSWSTTLVGNAEVN